MNNRERILRAIRFERPDAIPFTVSPLPAAFLRHGEELMELFYKYPNDFYDVGEVLKIPKRDTAHYRADGSYFKEETDEWGCVWHYHQEGLTGEVKKSPLENWSAIEDYHCPPVDDSPQARQKTRQGIDHLKARGFMGWGGSGGGRLYERMQWVRGVENLMFDIADNRPQVERLADLILEEDILPGIRLATQAGADVVGISDDWGTQLSLLVHPDYWRRVFKPRYKRLFDLVHQGGALVWMHSDGMILDIIPDLIEVGLDVINPQCNCMDLAKLKTAIDGKLCIVPDIDRQRLLPFGSPKEIREYIRMIHDTFSSPEGGLIYTCEFSSDTPLENCEAVLKAFYEFRN